MHFGIEVVNLGDYADPRRVVALAQAAEAAGWEALFVWDHLAFVWGAAVGEPWVILAAVAQATTRLRLGTAVTPLPRRRPQVLANTLATLDVLSQGRVTLGVGLGGSPNEFTAFGEPDDLRVRAARLDEGLEVLSRLLEGETVTHHGPHYTVEGVQLSPLPVQRPRVPIWIGGDSEPAYRRAARWDGWVIGVGNEKGEMNAQPEAMGAKLKRILAHRTATTPFDAALTGYTRAGDTALPRAFADVGFTWWLESLHGFRADFDTLLQRVKDGPPA